MPTVSACGRALCAACLSLPRPAVQRSSLAPDVRPRPLGFCGCTRCSEHVSARWIKERGDGFEGLGGREGPRATQIVPAECLQYRHSVRTRLSVTHWRVGGVLQHGHPCASHNLQGNASSTHASRAQPTAAATLIHRVCGGCPQATTYLAVSTRREHGVSAAIASPFLGENHTSDPTVCRVPLSLKFVACGEKLAGVAANVVTFPTVCGAPSSELLAVLGAPVCDSNTLYAFLIRMRVTDGARVHRLGCA